MSTLNELYERCPVHMKERFVNRIFHPGDMILKQQNQYDYVYILTEGDVKVTQISKTGASFLFHVIGNWRMLGEMELFSNNKIACNVEALSQCAVMQIPNDVFLEWLEYDFQLGMYLLKEFSMRLTELTVATTTNVLFPLHYRFLMFLDSLVKDGQSIVPYRKDTIAEVLGTTVRSVNRIIEKLVRDGIVHYEKGIITIISKEKLVIELNKK